MTKNWIAKLVVVTLIISSLTACAGKGAGSAAGTADQSVQQAENAAAENAEAENAATESAEPANADAENASAAPEAELAAEAATTDNGSAVDYSSGTPWPYIDLEGVVTPDTPTDPKDNFALYANKDKLLNLEIPQGRPFGGAFMDLIEMQAEDVKNMFLGEAPQEHDAKLAFDLFWLMMDWDSRNAVGVAPLKEEVDKVEQISTIDELMAYFVEYPAEKQLSSLWSTEVNPDLNDADRKVFWISDAGVLLGDSAEYKSLTSFGKIKKEAYTTLAKKILVKLGYSEQEAVQKIDNCLAFEVMMADSIYTNEESQRPDYISRINNMYSREDLEKLQGKLPILADLEENQGYPAVEQYMVTAPVYFEKMNELCVEENLPLIRDMVIVCGAIAEAGNLDRECYEWNVECRNAIRGSTGIMDDETAFSGRVSETLVWPVARLYTETYLKQEDKDRISAMTDEIMDAYHGILENADFLSDETRAKAVEKLDAMQKFILYPDDWEDYSCEELNFASKEDGGTLNEALEAISRFYFAQSAKEFSEPVDKTKWEVTPQTVNCFFGQQINGIYILGAYARGDNYNSEMSDEELYGTLGVMIGHEISHAFDSTGAQFDKNGDMRSWWTEEDYSKFLERNKKMVDYYNAIHPWEGQDLHGSAMTGEACADMAGFKAMLRIAANNPDFDYDKFFRAFAGRWLAKDTLQYAYARINDTHPMNYLRTNCTLQQYDEFLDFYGITEGDNMYLAPEDRVAIW